MVQLDWSGAMLSFDAVRDVGMRLYLTPRASRKLEQVA